MNLVITHLIHYSLWKFLKIETAQDATNMDERDAKENLITLPLDNEMLSKLQLQDALCANILAQIEKRNITKGQMSKVQNQLLKRYVIDGDKTYETSVLPRALIAQILKMAHDDLGHNRTHRMYILLKRLYYWKALKPSVTKHIQRCYYCQRRNKTSS